ncbi:hypothetical protein BpHYR1_032820 [Brachionus plicatilis]|uniref:Uncharacterized protein n=1 Tax=Brachionus plicatilis TaxID=10195 RepID=A0A3M7SGU3_BRAPC|nr:hypothetical protein BpHYR1_032820 [Brachionus plicatilis]
MLFLLPVWLHQKIILVPEPFIYKWLTFLLRYLNKIFANFYSLPPPPESPPSPPPESPPSPPPESPPSPPPESPSPPKKEPLPPE